MSPAAGPTFHVLLLLLLCGGFRQNASAQPNATAGAINDSVIRYPESVRDTAVVDDYHGTRVVDPYRWLEDDRAPATEDWVNRQNTLTDAYLGSIPFRPAIRRRLERLYDYERVGVPTVTDGYLYFQKNDGLQNQYVLYRSRKAPGAAEELVLDPNTFSEDNTTSLAGYAFSKNEKYLAYERSAAGSDWQSIHVLNLETLVHEPDSLAWIKFSGIAWSGNGFFYSRYPAPVETGGELSDANEGHQLYYHALGTDQSADQLIFEDQDHPQRNVYGSTDDYERYLIVSRSAGTSGNAVDVATLEADGTIGELVGLVSGFEKDYRFVGWGSTGGADPVGQAVDPGGAARPAPSPRMLFWTNDEASNGRVVGFDLADPSAPPGDVLPEDTTRVLRGVEQQGANLYVNYLRNVSSEIEHFLSDGSYRGRIELPGIGTATGVSSARGGGNAYFGFSSFTTPGVIYELDSLDLAPTVWRRSDNGFDASLYETKQVTYKSKDGTEVPMFIIHRRGLVLDGARPTLLYGYGGFDISIQPKYAVMRLDLFSPILEQGGVCAVANIRGGGEFGSAWHDAGKLARKQNVFDDFIAAAEYLQGEGYTNPKHTAIYGRSNGGLLVGACMTQRPDLFGVALPAVGVLDMLRYHEFTIGWAWAGDYGRSDSTEAFDYLYAYSPLHNVRRVDYPATLITTADHDDRVVPAHSFKFAAELQRQQTGDEPVLIRVDKSSGHGSGKPVDKQIDEATDVLAFLFRAMGVEYTAP